MASIFHLRAAAGLALALCLGYCTADGSAGAASTVDTQAPAPAADAADGEAAQLSYPLVCRGGGNIVLTYVSTSRTVSIIFGKASVAAGTGFSPSLPPGTCAWRDRVIGPNEPSCLQDDFIDANAYIVVGRPEDSTLVARGAPWASALKRNTAYQEFLAYNPGGSGACFRINGLGPSKVN